MSQESNSDRLESNTVRNSDNSSDSYGLQGLSDEAERVLRYVDSNPPEKVSVRKISSNTDLSRYYAKQGLEELEKQAYLEVSGKNTRKTYSLTPPVERVLENSGGVSAEKSDNSSDSGRSPQVSSNVHDLAFRLPFSDECLIAEEDRETVLQAFESLSWDQDSEEFVGDWDRFHFRISGESVVVYDKGEYHGFSPTFLKNQAARELGELREFLKEEYKLRFEDRSVIQASLFSQDVAIEDHPLVLAVRDSDLSLQRTWVGETEEGEARLQIDVSHGEVGEVEETMRGPYSSERPFQEEHIQRELDDMARRVENPRATRLLRDLGEYLARNIPQGHDPGEASGDVSSSFAHTEGLGFEVDVEASRCETGRVNLSQVSMLSDVSVSGQVYVSEGKDIDKAESLKTSGMSVSENFKDLDLRELPGTVFEDSAGRRMEVWFIDGVERSQGEVDASVEEKVVFRRGEEKLEVAYEELKSWVSEEEVEIVEA